MFKLLYDSMEQLVAHNQVFSGGAVLMVGGAIAAYLRNTPRKLFGFLRRFFLMEIFIADSDPAFNWVLEWLAAQSYSKKWAMNLAVSTKDRDADRPRSIYEYDDSIKPGSAVAILSPARGEHLLWYKRMPMWVHREVETGATDHAPPKETIKLFLATRNRQVILDILAEAKEIANPPADDRVSMYRMWHESWQMFTKRQPRPVESVILRDGLMEDLLADITLFRSRRDWYVERGIPYRKGLIFYGPPGTGKSSTILAIASKLRMGVCVCNPAASNMNDHALLIALAETPADSIVLIEDIDAAFNEDRESSQDKHNGLTFGGLLNAIDGVAAGDGRIIIATTNHIDKIDPALIRHGRFDRKELIDYPTEDQVKRMFFRFFPDAHWSLGEDFAAKVSAKPETSAATIQAHLLQHCDNAFAAMSEWKNPE